MKLTRKKVQRKRAQRGGGLGVAEPADAAVVEWGMGKGGGGEGAREAGGEGEGEGGLNKEQLDGLNNNIIKMTTLIEDSRNPKTTFNDVRQVMFKEIIQKIRILASQANDFESLIQIKTKLEDIKRLSKSYELSIDQLDSFINHLFLRAKKLVNLADGWGADWSDEENAVYYFPINNPKAPSQWEIPTAAAAGGRRRRGRSRKTTGRSRKTTGRKTRSDKKH